MARRPRGRTGLCERSADIDQSRPLGDHHGILRHLGPDRGHDIALQKFENDPNLKKAYDRIRALRNRGQGCDVAIFEL